MIGVTSLDNFYVLFLHNSTCNVSDQQGATKDVQQLFTAMDRRIEALRRNQSTGAERESADTATPPGGPQVPFDDDDKESFLDHDEPHSSPDSSPDRQVGSRTRLVVPPPPVKTVGVASKSEIETGEVEGRGKGAEEAGEEVGGGAEKRGGRREGRTSCSSDGAEEVRGDRQEGGQEEEGDGTGSDRESTTATPPSSRSPSVAASTTTISSSDNQPESQL